MVFEVDFTPVVVADYIDLVFGRLVHLGDSFFGIAVPVAKSQIKEKLTEYGDHQSPHEMTNNNCHMKILPVDIVGNVGGHPGFLAVFEYEGLCICLNFVPFGLDIGKQFRPTVRGFPSVMVSVYIDGFFGFQKRKEFVPPGIQEFLERIHIAVIKIPVDDDAVGVIDYLFKEF
jgi:hypothetical protein